MRDEKKCKIVQDLLPNYIDNLTSQETSNYIQSHLENCKECNKIFENMQKDIKCSIPKLKKEEVKYIKKFANKVRILKTIILIVIVILIVVIGRRVFILSDLCSKAEKYSSPSNYHVTTSSIYKEGYIRQERFVLNEHEKLITSKVEGNKITTTTMYAIREGENKYNVNIFTQGDNNIANLNQKMSMDSGIYNTLYTENLWQLFLYSISASITNTTFDGKECYYIANFRNPYTECQAGTYIDKETGLSLSTIAYEFKDVNGIVERYPATERTYEFGTVTENDFEEPNLSDYKVE